MSARIVKVGNIHRFEYGAPAAPAAPAVQLSEAEIQRMEALYQESQKVLAEARASKEESQRVLAKFKARLEDPEALERDRAYTQRVAALEARARESDLGATLQSLLYAILPFLKPSGGPVSVRAVEGDQAPAAAAPAAASPPRPEGKSEKTASPAVAEREGKSER